jgi:enolase-phosphatase E1
MEQGFKIYIYSSGSVEAQKLLFGNSEYGDMSPFISGNFDTNIGHKQESQSYKNIVNELKVDPSNILFLSDIPNEVKAAKEAGMGAIILDRPKNPTELSEDIKNEFKVVQTFDEIDF